MNQAKFVDALANTVEMIIVNLSEVCSFNLWKRTTVAEAVCRGRERRAPAPARERARCEGTSTSPHSMTSSQGGMFSLSRVARPSRAESEALRTRIGTACFTIPPRRAVRRAAQERLDDELETGVATKGTLTGRHDERYGRDELP